MLSQYGNLDAEGIPARFNVMRDGLRSGGAPWRGVVSGLFPLPSRRHAHASNQSIGKILTSLDELTTPAVSMFNAACPGPTFNECVVVFLDMPSGRSSSCL